MGLYGDPTDNETVAWQARLVVTELSRGRLADARCSVAGGAGADWLEAFALAPSLEVAYVWHASEFTREVLDGLLRIVPKSDDGEADQTIQVVFVHADRDGSGGPGT